MIFLFLAVGILNVVVAYDQDMLMLSHNGRGLEAWFEGIFYVLLWPVQLAWWIGVQLWAAMDWCHRKWEAWL